MRAWLLGSCLSMGTLALPAPTEARSNMYSWFALFMLVLSSVQWGESRIWLYFNQHSPAAFQTVELNRLTRQIMILLYLQPLAHCIGLIFFSSALDEYPIPMHTYLVVMIVESVRSIQVAMNHDPVSGSEAAQWTTQMGPQGHLMWLTRFSASASPTSKNTNAKTYERLPRGRSGYVYIIGILLPL